MDRDPHNVLQLHREATPDEVRWAYERRLREVARLGAWKVAEQVDAAYTLLRDPERRMMFDRHGVADPDPRMPSLDPGATMAVPFRAWSPGRPGRAPIPTTTRATKPRSAPARALWLIVVAAGCGALAEYALLH